MVGLQPSADMMTVSDVLTADRRLCVDLKIKVFALQEGAAPLLRGRRIEPPCQTAELP